MNSSAIVITAGVVFGAWMLWRAWKVRWSVFVITLVSIILGILISLIAVRLM